MEDKRGCSFRNVNWGIAVWPTLLKTKTGNERRAKESEKKRKGSSQRAAGEVSDIAIQESTPTPAIRLPAKVKGKGKVSQPIAMQRTVSADPSLSSGNAMGSGGRTSISTFATPVLGSMTGGIPNYDFSIRACGREERVFFENLAPFEEVLRAPSRSSTTLGIALAEVKSLMVREAKQVEMLDEFTKERRLVMDHLVSRLDYQANLAVLREQKAVTDAEDANIEADEGEEEADD